MSTFQHFDIREQEGVTVLTLKHSRIHDQEEIKQLSEELSRAVLEKNIKNMLFDMKNVTFVSSAILNRMIVLDKQLKSDSGKLGFCVLGREVAEVFGITRLDKLFQIYGTAEEGIADMKQ